MRRSWMVVPVLAVALALTGCGSGDSDDTAGDNELASLTVAMPSIGTGVPDRIADARGYFKDEGLDVTFMENTAANTSNILIAGRADLAAFSIGGPTGLAAKGKDIGIIYAAIAGSGSGSVLVSADRDDLKNIEDLKSVDNCTIVTQATGSAAFGNAGRYNDEFDLGCKISPLADPGAQVGAIAADNAVAIVGTPGNFAKAVNDGVLKVLVDTTDPQVREKYFSENYPLAVLFGLTPTLEKKSDSVKAYVRALDKASKDLMAGDPKALAEEVKGSDAYAGMTPDAIALSIEEFRTSYQIASDGGAITREQWDSALKALKSFAIPGLDTTAPKLQYDAIIKTDEFVE